MISFVLPPVKSAANLREHWRTRAKRVKQERKAAFYIAQSHGAPKHFTGTITFARYGWQPLDSDNLASACKAARDGIADAIDMDDGDEALEWKYEQYHGKPALVVTMEAK